MLVSIFCFFKQMTAYEMRISDWSSDVCSSDLWVLASHGGLDTLAFNVDLWSARGPVPRDLVGVAVRMKEIQYSSRTRASTDSFRRTQKLRAAFNEIGRASGRERVCQYV